MASGEKTGEDAVYDVLLSDDYFADFLTNEVEPLDGGMRIGCNGHRTILSEFGKIR